VRAYRAQGRKEGGQKLGWFHALGQSVVKACFWAPGDARHSAGGENKPSSRPRHGGRFSGWRAHCCTDSLNGPLRLLPVLHLREECVSLGFLRLNLSSSTVEAQVPLSRRRVR
jgi:hypothetical protein